MMKKYFYAIVASSFLATGVGSADDTPLAEKMDEVSGSLKMLRRADGDFAKCLELVRQAQTQLLETFAFVPALIEKMPDGKEKQVALANYKKTLAASYQTLCGLEIAYLSEDQDKIDDAMDLVKKSRKDGHEEYIEEGE
ncbi:MAG: hypothetical protein ACSHYB_04605 [Roseibacillus sp.]